MGGGEGRGGEEKGSKGSKGSKGKGQQRGVITSDGTGKGKKRAVIAGANALPSSPTHTERKFRVRRIFNGLELHGNK